MWRKWWAPNNASKQQMGFNSAFKGLKLHTCMSRHHRLLDSNQIPFHSISIMMETKCCMDLKFHVCMKQKSNLISSQQPVFQLVFVSLMYMFICILYFGCNLYSPQAYDIFYTRWHMTTPPEIYFPYLGQQR